MNRYALPILAVLMLIAGPVSAKDSKTPPLSPPKGAQQLEPGLSYKVLKKGRGPLISDEFLVLRTLTDAWKDDGTRTSTAETDGLSTVQLRQVKNSLPVMATILANMRVGEKRRWWVSKDLIPEGSRALEKAGYVMDITLVDTVKPLPAPENVAQIPSEARLTKDGIGILTLKAGDGQNHPKLENDIEVHYSGWTTDGRMFDSSQLRKQTATFPLGRLIEGWQLAIPELTKGEIARIWIPGALAYDNRADRPFSPKGMLVFDVEIVDIK
ncbi:MAG: FKBP-type peptidyl-prolyl cis-trans isomerase [Sphingomonadales bacterium]